jgi:hypothetical protein
MLSIFSTVKRTALVACSAAALALSALFVAPAFAARSAPVNAAIPQAASGCNQVVCMHITSPYRIAGHPGLWVTVNAWVRNTGVTFEGHYDLVNPRGYKWQSGGDRGWNHSQNYYWRNKSSVRGKWCVIAWEHNGPHHYTNIGEPCETVK